MSQYGERVHDCAGLIKGYLWSDTPTSVPKYNASQDVGNLLNHCKEQGTINTIPDIAGVLVFMQGHVGVYIGNGKVIEARGHAYGVVETNLVGRGWKNWGKLDWLAYKEVEMSKEEKIKLIKDKVGIDDNTIKYLEFYKYGDALIDKLAKALGE